MKNYLLISFCCLILFQHTAFSQNSTYKPINLEVKIIDTNINKTKIPKLYVTISDVPFSGVQFYGASKKTIKEYIELNKTYNYSFESTAKYMYLRLSCSDPTFKRSKLDGLENVYIIESGSKLKCTITEADYSFTGTGAGFLNFQNKIAALGYNSTQKDIELRENEQWVEYFKNYDRCLDSVLAIRLNLIKSNEQKLGRYFTEILIANCYGSRYYGRLREDDLIGRENSEYFKSMKAYYLSDGFYRRKPGFNDDILANSPVYANYLVEELNIEEGLKNNKNDLRLSMLTFNSIANITSKIDEEYRGILRDKLLTLFMLRLANNPNSKVFLEKVASKLNEIKYKRILMERVNFSKEGLPFKDFTLADTSGRKITLNDFKNKVVIMDFWYTGCSNCVLLNTAMHPVYKYFEGNSNVVFVSVSVDKDQAQWKNSVKTGKYSHNTSLNLYTNGEGSNNELINYYKIISYPTMKIVKNGLLFSTLPPIPTVYKEPGLAISKGAADLIELINRALKQKLSELIYFAPLRP